MGKHNTQAIRTPGTVGRSTAPPNRSAHKTARARTSTYQHPQKQQPQNSPRAAIQTDRPEHPKQRAIKKPSRKMAFYTSSAQASPKTCSSQCVDMLRKSIRTGDADQRRPESTCHQARSARSWRKNRLRTRWCACSVGGCNPG